MSNPNEDLFQPDSGLIPERNRNVAPQVFDKETFKPNPSVAIDLLAAPLRGAEGFVQSIYNLADFVTFDALPDYEKRFLGESKTAPGRAVEKISQFLTAFVPVAGQLSKIGSIAKLGTFSQALVKGAAADFLAFDAAEERLSNMLQEIPSLANPVTEFLAADKDDNQITGRLKNAIEGLGLGAVSESVMAGLRLTKAARAAKEGKKTAVELLAESDDIIRKLNTNRGTPVVEKLLPKLAKFDSKIVSAATEEFKSAGTLSTKTLVEMDTVGDLLQTVKSASKITKAKLPDSIKTLSDSAIARRAAKTISTLGGQQEDAILAFWRSQNDIALDEIAEQITAADMMESMARTIQQKAAEVGTTRSADQIAESILLLNKFSALQNRVLNIGSSFGKGLQLQKNINKQLLLSNKLVRDAFIEESGGDGVVLELMESLKRLPTSGEDSLAAVSKTLLQTNAVGGKIFRATQEIFVNGLLSGPTTSIVNFMSTALNTFALPIKGFMGAALSGNSIQMKAFMKQFGTLFGSLGDGMKAAKNFWRTGEGLDGLAKVTSQSDVIQTGAVSTESFTQFKNTLLGSFIDAAGQVVRAPTRALGSADMFFKMLAFKSGVVGDLTEKGLSLVAQGADSEALGRQILSLADGKLDDLVRASSESRAGLEAVNSSIEAGAKGLQQKSIVEETASRLLAEGSEQTQGAIADALDFGLRVADESTFTADLIPGTIGHKIQQFTLRHPTLKFVMPFVRTPLNLTKQAGQHVFSIVSLDDIPIPAISRIQKQQLADLAAGGLRASIAKGRTAAGMAIISSTALLVDRGLITGRGPTDPQARKAMMEAGWQPYSLKVDDKYISYSRLDPLSTLLGLVADLYDLHDQTADEFGEISSNLMSSLALATSRNVTNKTYLQGLSNLISVLEGDERTGMQALKSFGSAAVPNVIPQVIGTLSGDDAIREVRTIFDAIQARIPGLSEGLMPKRNLYGEVVERRRGRILGVNDKFAGVVSPYYVSEATSDPALEEMSRLGYTVRPPAIKQGPLQLIDYTNPGSKQTAYDRWLELHGEVKIGGLTMKDRLSRLVQSKRYQKLPYYINDDSFRNPRELEIQKIVSEYRRKAKQQMLKEFPQLERDMREVKRQQKLISLGIILPNTNQE